MSNALTLAHATSLVPSPEEMSGLKEIAALQNTGFFPNHIKNAPQALAVMLKGRELGVPPMHALSNIVMVQGKPTVSTELMLALIYRDHGKQALRIKETTNDRCTVEYRVEGWEGTNELTFTIEDAKRANLIKPGPWMQYPSVMLRWRAISQVAKLAFPESIGGMYSPGELGEDVQIIDDNIVSVPEPIETTSQPVDQRTPPPPPARAASATVSRFDDEHTYYESEPASKSQRGLMIGRAKALPMLNSATDYPFVKEDKHTNKARLDALVRIVTSETLDDVTKDGARAVIDQIDQWQQKGGIGPQALARIDKMVELNRLEEKYAKPQEAPEEDDQATHDAEPVEAEFVDVETGEIAQDAPAVEVVSETIAPDDISDRNTLMQDFIDTPTVDVAKSLAEALDGEEQWLWAVDQMYSLEDLDTLRKGAVAAGKFADVSRLFSDHRRKLTRPDA